MAGLPLTDDAGAPQVDASSVAGSGCAAYEEEVRLAMGWNGGVSLAVWMGGVAVELDEARRVTADSSSAAQDTTGTGPLYRALAAAFNRRLVIDILAGASAGGLNGALLAGVITHERVLWRDKLRSKWLAIGDFGELLRSLEDDKPTSVMQGELFHSELVKMFEELHGTSEAPTPPRADEPLPVLLDVQVTDVLGRQRQFVDDWGLAFYALEHRHPFQFRKWSQFDAASLALAARASASFPAAFEPVKIADDATDAFVVPQSTWAVDGGLLENAPIRQAIDLIPERRASQPVSRYVCYVNAAPSSPQDERLQDSPDLRQVIGYAINLPRTARVVDQLYALEDATRRAGITAAIGIDLLRLPVGDLIRTAEGLLAAYQRRRGALSLEELLGVLSVGGPGRAQRVLAQLASDLGRPGDLAAAAATLPWIPGGVADLRVDLSANGWSWGIRAAQRVVQLELDILRATLAQVNTADAAAEVFDARKIIDRKYNDLESARRGFMAPDGEIVVQAANLASTNPDVRKDARETLIPAAGAQGQAARAYLEAATRAFRDALLAIDPNAAASLFAAIPADPSDDTAGADTTTQPASESEPAPEAAPAPVSVPQSVEGEVCAFMTRALAVETVRRSFADDLDIESTQSLHVAQLTPLTESPLFDRGYLKGPVAESGSGTPTGVVNKPDRNLGPRVTKDKLAGVRLGHFAGFYRRSWRANDFMWGRLDGAAMIARLMIDPSRAAARIAGAASEQPAWTILSEALVPDGLESSEEPADRDRVAIIEELIGKQDDLRAAVAEQIKADLSAGEESSRGELTRALVARALQYEVLREELAPLKQAITDDVDVGASKSAVQSWRVDGSLNEVIAAIRAGQGAKSLPGLLGADDPDESVSELALRTVSHTLLVASAALGGVLPLGRALQPVRIPLLTVQGTTARQGLNRLCAALAFAGAAWFVNARLLAVASGASRGSNNSSFPDGKVPVNALWTSPVLAYWVCALAVLGFALVPAARALRGKDLSRRLLQGVAALLLFSLGGAVMFVVAIVKGGMSEALTTWTAPQFAPEWVLIAVASAGALHAAASSNPILRAASLLQKPLRRWVAAIAFGYMVLAVILLVYSIVVDDGFRDDPYDLWWLIALIMAIAASVTALVLLHVWTGWKVDKDTPQDDPPPTV